MLFTCLWFVSRPRPRNKSKRYETNMKYAWEIRASKIKICHRPWMKLNLSNEWALAHTSTRPAHTQTVVRIFCPCFIVPKSALTGKRKCLSFSRHKVKVSSHISLYFIEYDKISLKCRRRDSVNTHTYAQHIVHTCVTWIYMSFHVSIVAHLMQ